MSGVTATLAALDASRPAARDALFEALRIPSISGDPDHRDAVAANAAWLAERLEAIGFAVRPFEGEPPVVEGERLLDPALPTLTIYGHYDVQPPGPEAAWESPPFEPTVRDGHVFARGAADNKGNHVAALAALEHAFAVGLRLNVRYLLEGEEEVGSAALEAYVERHRARLASDHVLSWDGSFDPDGSPLLITGMRGLVQLALEARGAGTDVHAGMFGGAVPNPALALAQVVAGLKDERGRVTVAGFYDDIEDLGGADDVADEAILRASGATALVGEPDQTLAERLAYRPAIEVNGLAAGEVGQGHHTVIPRRAEARLTAHLVPGQDPGRVFAQLDDHVRAQRHPGVEVTLRGRGHSWPATLSAPSSRTARALADAYAATFGARPAARRIGGTLPIARTLVSLGGETVASGANQPRPLAHAPNEHLSLAHFERAADTIARFLFALSS